MSSSSAVDWAGAVRLEPRNVYFWSRLGREALRSGDAETAVDYIHRRDGPAEIYFVANGKPEAVTAQTAFRVTGRVPELWWPDSGKIEAAAVYERMTRP